MEIKIVDSLPRGNVNQYSSDTAAIMDEIEKLDDGRFLKIEGLSLKRTESFRQFAYRHGLSFRRHKVQPEVYNVYFWKEGK